jgi:alkylated DNA repair dioxygenase AlkB
MTSDLQDFVYFEEAISVEEEQRLLNFIEMLPFLPYVMRGQASRRDIVRFGHDYGPVGGTHHSVLPMPEQLIFLRERAGKITEMNTSTFVASVVTRYRPGSTIGWHSDMPMFGPIVFGFSLLNSCTFKLRPKSRPRNVFRTTLNPRSFYVMKGKIRSQWDHNIPPVEELRYSVTFRTLL